MMAVAAAGVLTLAACGSEPAPEPTSSPSPSSSFFQPLNYLPLGKASTEGKVTVTPPDFDASMAGIANAPIFLVEPPRGVIQVAVSLQVNGFEICPPVPYGTNLAGQSGALVPTCTFTLEEGEHEVTFNVFTTDDGSGTWLDKAVVSTTETFTVGPFKADNVQQTPPQP